MKLVIKKYLKPAITCLTLAAVFSCSKPEPDYVYEPPRRLGDGLEVSEIESEGLDWELIGYMIDDIGHFKYIHSILIIKNNKLVFEEYFKNYGPYALNNLYSVTKSFCSALTGIAVDRHYISDLNDPIRKYLQEYQVNWTGKEKITVKDLLTMSAGFEWDEDTAPYTSPENSHSQMNRSPEQVKYVLERPVAAPPGTKWVYNSGGVTVLGRIVSNAAGMDLDTFAVRYLFKPLGIGNHKWYIFPSGIYLSSGDLKLSSRDMAKFGLLYLNGGSWHGQQVISEEWIKASTEDHFIVKSQREVKYGYLWWKRPLLLLNGQRVNGYSAEGFGGQYIFVLPEYEMVVVFTSGINWDEEELTYQPVEIL